MLESDSVNQAGDITLTAKATLDDISSSLIIVPSQPFDVSTTRADVQLTVNHALQNFSEARLRGESAAAVILNPQNGDILAMASVPSFDPQKFIPAIEPDDWDKYDKDLTAPLMNRAVRSFAPGSTFKIPVAFAGCLAGVDRRRW